MRVTVDETLAHLGDPSVLLVDARSPDRYAGKPDPLDNVYGHIPGARNRYYRHNVTDAGTMRPAGELKADFEQCSRARRPKSTVMYCGSGITACHNLLGDGTCRDCTGAGCSPARGRSGNRTEPAGERKRFEGTDESVEKRATRRGS
jgi:thiosulfate/3-mercaptopyruvate sulfurtransferase